MSRHTDSQFESELGGIQVLFFQMCARATWMLREATRALFERDPERARRVVETDREVDRTEMELDRRCVQVLARRAPVGEDLRLVTSILKAVTDVERVGDLAVNIAERALELYLGPGIDPDADVQALAKASTDMWERAAESFRTRDSAVARGLHADDRAVDELNRTCFRTLIGVARDHPDQVERVLALSSVCRHFERVGDHAVNLGERVVFLVEGADVRHGG